ncbi:MAG TPA: protein kinase [Caulobacteraceae bacterium]|jgi:tRNA A-37 threonylcarbamoyl transferase component Bud32|nr:protein kinase [Caulobacteraceae bacterium]
MRRAPAADDRTIFQPEASPPPVATVVPAPRRAQGPLPSGALLNNIYEVRRFIARGGMGEVYEGVNVNTDERVAIKVMLPHLAADPKVQALFRKEARILTELAHPALVRYRVLAHEPQLEVFYIVTEFIDGRSLSELLGELRPSATQLKALTRRLAEGLAVAHAMGAVHRDMSPDNVLLPRDRLDQAKIIDFGIARETGLSHQTVVGDGFAGKLGYVAPEQFGDFGRRIGPWTDIYSLGLVGLALAAERAPDMGVTLVDAVDRRREGVDLAPLPACLRPVFGKMLAPDPSNRFQTMAEVIGALDDVDTENPAAVPASPPADPDAGAPVAADGAAPAPEPEKDAAAQAEGERRALNPWLVGAVGSAVLVAVALGISLTAQPSRKAGTAPASAPVVPAASDPAIPAAVPIPPEAVETAVPAKAPNAAVNPAPPVHPTKPKTARAAPPLRWIEPPPSPFAVAAASPPVAATIVPAEPVARTAAAAPAAPVAANPVEACWRAEGNGWSYLGYAPRPACVAQVFSTCSAVHGRWGKTQLRRYDDKLQAKGAGLLSNWQAVGPSNCAAAAAGGE